MQDSVLSKEQRQTEFRSIVYKYELSSEWLTQITGRDEDTVRSWRSKGRTTRTIPQRQLEKVKEALGLPIE
jgi:hypothetical protein